MSYEAIIEFARKYRLRNRKIVFKTGCFDIFHIGHLRALEYSAGYGALFVGVGSDSTVKALKGIDRPAFDVATRVELVSSLKCVSYAFELNEPCIGRIDHHEALRELKPDYWVLPPSDKALDEKMHIADMLGIEILLKDELSGISSTGLAALIRSGYGA